MRAFPIRFRLPWVRRRQADVGQDYRIRRWEERRLPGAVTLVVEKGLPAQKIEDRLKLFLDQTPPHLKNQLRRINVLARPNPQDANWQTKFNDSKFKSSATGGCGVISYWDCRSKANWDVVGIFYHELGHLNDRRSEVDWEARQRADMTAWRGFHALNRGVEIDPALPRFRPDILMLGPPCLGVTSYGNHNPTEDWAESFGMYMHSIQHDGIGTLPSGRRAYFSDYFPARAQVMQEVFLTRECRFQAPTAETRREASTRASSGLA